MRHRIDDWRRKKGHKPFDWKSDCYYFINQFERSMWVAKIQNGTAFVMTCMNLEI